MVEKLEEGFLWLPRREPINWKYLIDSVDETRYVTSVEYTKALCPDIGSFKMSLLNLGGRYTDRYIGGESVQIYIDYRDATTKRFEGILEKPSKRFSGNDYTLEIQGSHVSSETLDITVTESYSNIGINLVLIDIIGF